MLNRISLGLALAVPVVLVLLALAAIARPARPAADAGDRAPRPTAAGAAQSAAVQPATAAAAQPAASEPAAQAPTAAPEPTAPPEPTAAPAPRPSGPPAPDFDGGGAWINSPPLRLADLGAQGKVTLVDFWTYGCYNCQNTLPYVKQWWDKYKDQGLVIVGVHTPEFQSEHVLANVQAAVRDAEIGWPVVQDNDYAIWRAYGNRYWPRFYLVDERGQIIYDHIGEGAYDETDRQIAAALAAAKGQ